MKLIMENWKRFSAAVEESYKPKPENRYALAACAIFANKNIKGKESTQNLISSVDVAKQYSGDFISNIKKAPQIKRGVEGVTSIVKHRSGHIPEHPDRGRISHRKTRSEPNEMNQRLEALSNVLVWAKGGAPGKIGLESKNPFYKQLYDMTEQIKRRPHQYNIERWSAIGRQTDVTWESIVDTRFALDRDDRRGIQLEDTLIITTVAYLDGPLRKQSYGAMAGLLDKASEKNKQLGQAFGTQKGIGSSVRAGVSTLSDESPEQLGARIDKFMPEP